MKDVLKTATIIVGLLLLVVGFTWIIQGNNWFMYKVFAPKYEQARRETFEHSRAFNQGMVQELQNMQFQYIREKDPKAKQALASIILHRASGYNLEDPVVPANLRLFINGLKREQ